VNATQISELALHGNCLPALIVLTAVQASPHTLIKA
jgi:hypothetical protein